MKFFNKLFTPPHLIFTLILALAFFTGCQVESNEDEKATYTVTYNANGGSGEMKAQTAEEGKEITLTENAFTRVGYTFSGWNTEADGKGTDHADKSTFKLTENLTLYAKWNPNAYKVRFCDDSGNADDTIIETTYDTEFALPETTTMSKTGYNFYGWNTEPDGSGTDFKPGEKVKNLATEAGTVTLYVRWLEKGAHTITYVLNGGTNDESNPETFLERNAVELKDPSRKFYEFAGWYGNADFSGEKLSGWNAGEKTGDITLYAKWAVTQASITAAIKAGNTNIVLTGEISAETITAIRKALLENSDARIILDLSGTTGLTEIPELAFVDEIEFVACKALAGIVLPEGIESINRYAFWYCPNLTDIVIPDSVKTIGEAAFQGSGLAGIKFGSGLESIGELAFQSCNSLTKITVPGNVKTIGYGAFSNSANLEELVLEEGVQTIGEAAFADCPKLAAVTIPKSVTSVGNSAFDRCDALQTVNYGGTMAEWKAFAAEKVGTSNDELLNATIYCTDGIVIPVAKAAALAETLEPGEYRIAMSGTVTEKNGWPAELKAMVDILKNKPGVKVYLDLKDVELFVFSDGSITVQVFDGCTNLTGIVIPDCANTIYGRSFANCTSLREVIVSENVKSIGEDAFSGCTGLERIALPESLTEIGMSAFYGCRSLETLTIPASLTSIGEGTFFGCDKLETVNYGGTKAQWEALVKDVDIDLPSSATVKCSDGIITAAANAAELIASLESGEYNITVTGAITGETISAIRTALQDNGKAKINLDLSQTTGLTSIAYGAFAHCSRLVSVNIPNSVTSIATTAFVGCSSLTSVNIPDSVTSIGDSAFGECNGLTNINIPNSVTSIARCAFRNCNDLTAIVIPDSVDSIGERVFEGCSSLTELTVSEGNKTYESYKNCIYTKAEKTFVVAATGLTSIEFFGGVTSIGDAAFYTCKNLTNITIPDGVTSIGEVAFYSCGNLTSVTIPKSVTKIEFGAFYYCEKLKTVVYDGKKSEWKAISINDELGGSGQNANIALSIATINCTDGDITPTTGE